MKQKEEVAAALFDLDGVIIDTEKEYSLFWQGVGRKYFPENPSFHVDVKGGTLTRIQNKYFAGNAEAAAEIERGLTALEAGMDFPYIKGVIEFLDALRSGGVKTAMVTSSNEEKMSQVWRVHPELATKFDRILTAECFRESKPAPECYLTAAKELGVAVSQCVVFEDSRNGLKSGHNAGMRVVGLTTTLPVAEVEALADWSMEDFQGFTLKNLRGL